MPRWISLFIILSSCNTSEVSEAPEVPYPDRNPPTCEGIELGRLLFYDPILSVDSTVSCSSCHVQELAFSDGQKTSSQGVSGQRLLRHTPSLTNVGYQQHFFWDGGSPDLESQVFLPLTHEDEMASDLSALTARLQESDKYPQMFQKAFGSDSIVVANIARALAQFQRTFTSWDAKYDRKRVGKVKFTEAELQGEQLFQIKCASCHPAPYFTDNDFHNNGLDASFSLDHERVFTGRYRITYDSADLGAYKTPTLRNSALTAPYMHDGRFATIEEVFDHYRNPVLSATLAPQLSNGLPISKEEELALIAFLGTLTDYTFISREDLKLKSR